MASGRIDNRAELCRALQISLVEQESISDSRLLEIAYATWGENAPIRIYGDWFLAGWHPEQQRLFLARDHFGNTSFFYISTPQLFAFATSRQPLLALAPKIDLDELYLAQLLISWPACQGERTIHSPIKRLPPAHCLTLTPQSMTVRCYWRLEETPVLRLQRREEYLEGFIDVFDESVRCRLRTDFATDPPQRLGCTLSGGLDSGAVAVTAAAMLAPQGRRLSTYTSIPISSPACYVGTRFGDEFPLAQFVANYAKTIDLQPIDAADCSPITGIRQMLAILREPSHAACNFFWMLDLFRTAYDQGCRVLLTGQWGNAGFSWEGNIISQPLWYQLKRLGLESMMKMHIKQLAPQLLLSTWRRLNGGKNAGPRMTAVHPDFARRIKLFEQRMIDPAERMPHNGLEGRFCFLLPGRANVGCLYAALHQAIGVEARDPTADARLLAYTVSVPDWVFTDPTTGMDRWLARNAMVGRLPDEVRLNKQRGRQAGDLVPRLRACGAEVEQALGELASGPAAEYLDVSYMKDVWRKVQSEDTAEAFRLAVTVLTRGIMCGLFVNGFYDGTYR